ncbi:Oxidoreductase HTATIP2 [Mycena kentingensis (nom. inval.)]|nr:Oxidoreductase HTATIP2 [Mycena kentingensis (nom. inval.)]
MSTPKTALVLGATGQVGGALLRELLASSHFSRVAEFGRKTTNLETLTTGKDKLEQHKIDFDNIDSAALKAGNWDVVYIALGTTAKAAGSTEAFERIDREYVINAARAAKTDSPQRLVYVSSAGADPKSRFLYVRSKGLTEEGLASLGYQDTIVFRPAVLAGVNRSETRIGEGIARAVTGVLSHISSSLEIKIGTLAKSLVAAGVLGSSELPPAAHANKAGRPDAPFTLIDNAGALGLAKHQL